MDLKTIGPLICWSIMFAVGVMVKYFTFKNDSVWFDIAPDVTLWASGILFTIAAADAFYQPKILSKYAKKETGMGFEMDYEVTLSETYEPTHSKYLYLFLFGLGGWIINVFLSGFISARLHTTQANPLQQPSAGFDAVSFALLIVAVVIASSMVFIALQALKEVSK
ncbi:MAG TPA: hypothetical protein VKN18_33005 [Blastocatellia bacterium]|nr:hypothetical protein [Blastocatellia bacterium]